MSLFSPQLATVHQTIPFKVIGQVQGISGLTIEAAELALPIGALCKIHSFGGKTSTAEVIGFADDKTLLMPLPPVTGVARGCRTAQAGHAGSVQGSGSDCRRPAVTDRSGLGWSADT